MSGNSRWREEILREFPRLGGETKQLIAAITKGRGVLLLRLRVMDLLLSYSTITVRMLYYRLVSLFDYPNDRNFYKRMGYSLKRIRKLFPDVNQKFRDPTRPLRFPAMPTPGIELWIEKGVVIGSFAMRFAGATESGLSRLLAFI